MKTITNDARAYKSSGCWTSSSTCHYPKVPSPFFCGKRNISTATNCTTFELINVFERSIYYSIYRYIGMDYIICSYFIEIFGFVLTTSMQLLILFENTSIPYSIGVRLLNPQYVTAKSDITSFVRIMSMHKQITI